VPEPMADDAQPAEPIQGDAPEPLADEDGAPESMADDVPGKDTPERNHEVPAPASANPSTDDAPGPMSDADLPAELIDAAPEPADVPLFTDFHYDHVTINEDNETASICAGCPNAASNDYTGMACGQCALWYCDGCTELWLTEDNGLRCICCSRLRCLNKHPMPINWRLLINELPLLAYVPVYRCVGNAPRTRYSLSTTAPFRVEITWAVLCVLAAWAHVHPGEMACQVYGRVNNGVARIDDVVLMENVAAAHDQVAVPRGMQQGVLEHVKNKVEALAFVHSHPVDTALLPSVRDMVMISSSALALIVHVTDEDKDPLADLERRLLAVCCDDHWWPGAACAGCGSGLRQR